jgi:hypothetical protein
MVVSRATTGLPVFRASCTSSEILKKSFRDPRRCVLWKRLKTWNRATSRLRATRRRWKPLESGGIASQTDYQAKQEQDAIYETSAKENEPNAVIHDLSWVALESTFANLDFGIVNEGVPKHKFTQLRSGDDTAAIFWAITTVEMLAKAQKKQLKRPYN